MTSLCFCICTWLLLLRVSPLAFFLLCTTHTPLDKPDDGADPADIRVGIQWRGGEACICVYLFVSEPVRVQYALILFSGSISSVPAVPFQGVYVWVVRLICVGESESDLVAVMINGGNFQC